MSVVSPSAVSLTRVKAVVRALLPLFVTLCCLVFGLVATPAAGAGPMTPTVTPTDSGANHTGNATVTLYDAGNATFDDAGEVESAIENDTLDRPDRMVVDDTLLAVLDSERLADAMAAHDGSTTERFLAALDGEADLYVVQTMPSPMVTPTYARLGAENVTAYRDGTTVYAVVDTANLAFVKMGDDGTLRQNSFDDEQFTVDFGFGLYEPRWDPPEPEGPDGPTFSISGEQSVTTTSADGPTTGTPGGMSETPGTTTGTPGTATGTQRAATGTPGTATETTAGTQSPAVTANGTGSNAEPPTTTSGSGPGFTVSVFVVAFLVVLAAAGRRD